MKYKGEKCFLCNETFNDDDDVVVCPDCGTPYHRHCYKEAGSCINHHLHELHESWKSTKESEAYPENDNINTGTDFQNQDQNQDYDKSQTENKEFSEKITDGFISIDLSKPFFGLDPDEDFEGAKMKELFAFVKTNTLYYIPLFKKMKSMGSKISFNFTSFFFPYFYFASRKMWLMALVSVFVTLLLKVPSVLISFSDSITYNMFNDELIQYAQTVFQNMLAFIDNNYSLIETLAYICNIGSYIFKIAMCLFGNWLYYRFTIKSVNKIKLRNPDEARSMIIINNAGGISVANIFLITIVILAGYIGMSFLINLVSFLM